MKITRLAAAAALGLAGLLLASPAQAADNEVVVDYDSQACAEVQFTTGWATDTHLVSNAYLVVKVGDEVQSARVGGAITVGPFDRPTEVQWRVFGGAERDYDSPQWGVGRDIINAYGTANGWGWTVGADVPEWVPWHSFWVDGCIVPPVPFGPEASCDQFVDVLLPVHEGVTYQQSAWVVVTPGTYGTAVVATAVDGWVFADGSASEWSFEVSLPTCPGEQGPPGPEGPAGATASPDPAGEDAEDGEDGISGGTTGGESKDGGKLPLTGTNLVFPAVAVGGSLVTAGGALMWRLRRKPLTFTA